jgi:GNAT superfamily N-acetyltransferase
VLAPLFERPSGDPLGRRLAPEAHAVLEVPAGYGGRGEWLLLEDAPRLARLLEACRHEVKLTLGGLPRPGDATRMLLEGPPGSPGAPPANRFIAGLSNADGDLTALLDVVRDYPSRGIWCIAALIVRPDLRGCGIAAELVERLERWAHAEGGRALHFPLSRLDTGSIHFARRCGFVDHGDVVFREAARGLRLAIMARPVR